MGIRHWMAAAMVALPLAACGESEAGGDERTLLERAEDLLREADSATADDRKELERALEVKLEHLDRELEGLRAAARQKGGEARQALEQRLGNLEELEDRARRKLEELRSSGGETWRRVLREARDAADSLAHRLDQALSDS